MTRGALLLVATGLTAAAAISGVLVGGGPASSTASSHREAPLIADDPAADNADVYAFVSPDKASAVTLVANYIPFEDPAGETDEANRNENAFLSRFPYVAAPNQGYAHTGHR
jgi:Domain of unknown function (DUF4331)